MNKTMIFAALAAMLAPFAYAAHTPIGGCDGEGSPALGILEIATGVPGGTQIHGQNDGGVFYVDDRNYALANGIWIYEESNGIYTSGGDAAHNLQRGGASPYVPDDNEICVDDPNVIPDVFFL